MKAKILLLSLLTFCLTGCSIATPVGTFTWETEKTSEDIELVNEDGSSSKLVDVDDLEASVDKLLNGVDLPQGVSTDELKEFVYNNLDSLGLSLEDIDLSSLESEEEIKQAIEDALKELESSESSSEEVSTEE